MVGARCWDILELATIRDAAGPPASKVRAPSRQAMPALRSAFDGYTCQVLAPACDACLSSLSRSDVGRESPPYASQSCSEEGALFCCLRASLPGRQAPTTVAVELPRGRVSRLAEADGGDADLRFVAPDWVFERKLAGVRLLAFK